MISGIDKLKHFHVENYSGTNFTDDLNDGEEFLYTTIGIKVMRRKFYSFNNRFRTTKKYRSYCI